MFGEGEVVEGHRWYTYRLSIVTIVLSLTTRPQFAIEYLRLSNQQGSGSFGAKFGKEGLKCDLVETGLSYAKEIMSISLFCRLNTMHERDIQTTERTVTSIAVAEIAC